MTDGFSSAPPQNTTKQNDFAHNVNLQQTFSDWIVIVHFQGFLQIWRSECYFVTIYHVFMKEFEITSI